MTPEEIKARCRKAYLIVHDNTVFGKKPSEYQMVHIFRDEKQAQEAANTREYDQQHMEFNKNSPKEKIKVCPVYLVPAAKID